jgi:FMN phosphatase YigB (HAD superfamily)
MVSLKYICDSKRHLVCLPYSIENLHQMAEELGIKKCWFHKNHYDIPKKRIDEITSKCHEVVTSRKILRIVKNTSVCLD